ncbi:uncharacterized protein DEA37_0013683, partial [Paragonimus westermani]
MFVCCRMTSKRAKTAIGTLPATSRSVEKPKNPLHQLKKTKSDDSIKQCVTTSLPTKVSSWVSSQLLQAMKIPALVIKQSELWTAIRDRYPKAKLHFLILPNQSIPRLTDVTLEHLPLLQSMHQAAEELALSCTSRLLTFAMRILFNFIVCSKSVRNVMKWAICVHAKLHFLILPNQSIPRLTDVTLEHLPLLQSMHQAAEELAL